MAPFYGWGSTASRLHFEEAVYFLPLSPQKFLVLILLALEGWKAESTFRKLISLNYFFLELIVNLGKIDFITVYSKYSARVMLMAFESWLVEF